MDLEIRPCKPDEEDESWAIEDLVWPTFNQMAEGSIAIDYDQRFHLVARDPDRDMLVATIDGIEFDWDGDPQNLPDRGWTEIIEKGLEGTGKTDWVAALGTSILPEYQQFGLSRILLEKLVSLAKSLGYKGVLAPVRPVYRWRALHLSLDEYADFRLKNGEHFDPWLRVHERIGGEIIGTCPGSAIFTAPVSDWQDWSKMKLPNRGRVLVPNAINYLEIQNGIGTLKEDSIWVTHS